MITRCFRGTAAASHLCRAIWVTSTVPDVGQLHVADTRMVTHSPKACLCSGTICECSGQKRRVLREVLPCEQCQDPLAWQSRLPMICHGFHFQPCLLSITLPYTPHAPAKLFLKHLLSLLSSIPVYLPENIQFPVISPQLTLELGRLIPLPGVWTSCSLCPKSWPSAWFTPSLPTGSLIHLMGTFFPTEI